MSRKPYLHIPTVPKIKKESAKSIYTKDGKAIKAIPPVENVKELKEILAKLPDNLPFLEPLKLVWFNVGMRSEHLNIGEDLGTWG